MATTLISLAVTSAISIGLSYLSTLFTKPKRTKANDDFITTLSQRGAPIPVVIGKRRVGYVFAWAGDRESHTGHSGGGGSFGQGGAEGPTTFEEGGHHVICVGPARKLHRIWSNGKVIFDTMISKETTPSGSTHECKNDEGTFRIYWGDQTEPLDAYLAAQTGVQSTFPHFCRVVWEKKRLGGSPTWPNIEYEIEAWPSWATWATDGINAADALRAIVCEPYPQGCGLDFSASFDATSMTKLFDLAAAEGFGVNAVFGDGKDADEVLGPLLEEMLFVMPQLADKLYPYAIRDYDESTLMVLDEDLVETTSIEQTREHGDLTSDKLVFVYKDTTINYRDRDISLDQDGAALSRQRPHAKRIDVQTVTTSRTVYNIAKRQQQAQSVPANAFSLRAFRSAATIRPGTPFSLDGVGNLRVTSIKRDFDDLSSQIDALFDAYGFEPRRDDLPPPPPPPPPPGKDPQQDIFLRAFEAPQSTGDPSSLTVVRVRAHNQILGAEVWISTDDASYVKVGNQDKPAPGGLLFESISELPDPAIIAVGPLVSKRGPDWPRDLQNLEGNDAAWESGEQVLRLRNESFYLKKAVAVDATYWRLYDLIRERDGTHVPSDGDPHPAGQQFVVFRPRDQVVFRHPYITSGQTVYIKVRPFTASKIMSLDEIVSISYTLP